jgi:hypothetical protein
MTQSTTREGNAPRTRRGWQSPAFTETSIDGGAGTLAAQQERRPHPPLPTSTLAKLGFSLESSFPLAARTEK